MTALKVSSCPSQELALTNCVFLNPTDHTLLAGDGDMYVELNGLLFTAVANGKFYEVAERPEVVDITEEEAGAAEGADVGDVRSDSDEDSLSL